MLVSLQACHQTAFLTRLLRSSLCQGRVVKQGGAASRTLKLLSLEPEANGNHLCWDRMAVTRRGCLRGLRLRTFRVLSLEPETNRRGVRRPGDLVHGAHMAAEGGHKGALQAVPQLDGLVKGRADEPPPVWGELHLCVDLPCSAQDRPCGTSP